jgi:uncharacterized membrane protein (DUF2068 family)
MGELMNQAKGNQIVPSRDRRVGKEAKAVYDEVRLRALQVDGVMALGGHIMEAAVALDQKRLSLAAGDPIVNGILAEIEATALLQIRSAQQSLFSDWGL